MAEQCGNIPCKVILLVAQPDVQNTSACIKLLICMCVTDGVTHDGPCLLCACNDHILVL